MTPSDLQKTLLPGIGESNMHDLDKIVSEHPYFSVGQLLYLYESKNNITVFESQAPKTALFFNNLHWLNWQLSQTEEMEDDGYQPTPAIEESTAENTEPDSPKNQDGDVREPENGPVGDLQAGPEEKVENATVAETQHTQPTDGGDAIAFEPLHTVDYFASLGIKLTEEPITNDKLGTQMKSFTEWLKSMKKVHTEKVIPPDEQTDRKIQNIAEDSNTNAGVVTEAMADVLVKQNKTEKAIELYRELSLINPHKSAYFAAKIESLKTA